MDKTKHQDLLEIVLRTLLDLPTYEIKSKLIEVLSLPTDHSMVFSLTLVDILNRIFSLRSILAPGRMKLGLADDNESKPKDVASLLFAREELDMLRSLAALINKLCLKDAAKSCTALVQSLVLPLTSYILDDYLRVVKHHLTPMELHQIDETLYHMAS